MSDVYANAVEAYWAACGAEIEAAQKKAWHWHSRRHHRPECQCKFCSSDGREPCSEDRPCGTCREWANKPKGGPT